MNKSCTFRFKLHEVAPYINWLYFFHAWGFPGRFSTISKIHGCVACKQNWILSFPKHDHQRATEAIQLYEDAQALLKSCDTRYQTNAKVAIMPACSEKEDLILFHDNQSFRLPLLRQQTPDKDGLCKCLSDYVIPINRVPSAENIGIADHIGIFACCADREMEDEDIEDEYMHLMHQTLADRLAEATAEKLHELVRKDIWGYASDEQLCIDELFCEKYQGKRPAIGYPSLPDQSLNFLLDNILDFSSIGIQLTENGAMKPHASTSGLMFAHPEVKHFSIGQIGMDQISDYAKRRNVNIEYIKKFLA